MAPWYVLLGFAGFRRACTFYIAGDHFHQTLAECTKLSSSEELASRVAAAARSRNRSLKKSAAITDDDILIDTQRRAVSFDAACISSALAAQAHIKNASSAASLRPASFDSRSSFDGRMSAFSPVDVPRLLIHSPASPLTMAHERALTPDSRLLTVPSPDFPRKQIGGDSPKGAGQCPGDVLPMSSLPHTLLGQLSALQQQLQQQAANAMAMETDQPKPNILSMGMTPDSFRSSLEYQNSLDSFNELKPSLSFDQPGPSCGDTPSAEMMAHMPPKSVIQDDIRNGQGRFQLVRKRGRSEVWNLFGQVLDTQTQSRLPYVACYACKVIYTDTGGGTGNMTRHRCPIGVSYRNSNQGSSTETMDPSSQLSSFESSVSVINRSNEHKALSVTITSDSSGSLGTHLLSQNSTETSVGELDRDVLTDSIVRCCATDMIDPAIFMGKGFRYLLERIWQTAKRVTAHADEIFPDIQMIKNSLQTNLRFSADDLKNELSRTPHGVCLSLENLSYNEKDFKVVHGCRISHDWKWRSSVLGVFKARENQSLNDIIAHVVHNYDLDRNLLRVTSSKSTEEFAPLKTFVDVKERLREILLAVMTTCNIAILTIVQTMDAVIKGMIDTDVRLPFEYTYCGEDIFRIQKMLIDWNDHHSMLEAIIKTKCPNLEQKFVSINYGQLRDIEHFLGPFRETVESLQEEKPNFHKVLPEWYALLHECQPSEEDTSPILRDMKLKATELLKREKDSVLTVEHRISTILNPRLNRKINILCTEQEKSDACEKIRAACGIRSERQPLSRGSSSDGEPQRKRRMFLSALEDDIETDDELECYLRSQFPLSQTKDLMTFWSTVGQAQFPSLASLARKLLSVPAMAPRTEIDTRLASVSPEQLHTFLMLRSMFDVEELRCSRDTDLT